MLADTDRPGIDEQYISATNATDLRVEADRRGAADFLIAAGWSKKELAGALDHLKAEWDSAAKPRRPIPRLVQALESYIRQEDRAAEAEAKRLGMAWTPPGPLADRARERADAWYANELRMFAQSMKSRAAVWAYLAPWLAWKGIAEEVGAAALLHWLDPNCPHCEGHGRRKVPHSPARLAICNKCHGSGKRAAPPGSAKVLDFMGERVERAGHHMRRRLHHR